MHREQGHLFPMFAYGRIVRYRSHLTRLSLVAFVLIASAPWAISKRAFRLSLVNRLDIARLVVLNYAASNHNNYASCCNRKRSYEIYKHSSWNN